MRHLFIDNRIYGYHQVTLLLALANDQSALLLADRRITSNGNVIDDEFNKLSVLFCSDAKLAVAFTGLATIDRFNTADWLAQTMWEIGKTKSEIALFLEELRVQANACFASLCAADKRLTIIFSGFVYWNEQPEPRVYVLSNHEDGQPGYLNFSLRTISAVDGVIVELAGMTQAIPEKTYSSLKSLMQKQQIPPSASLRFAVNHLQHAARHHRSSGLIGEQCNSAIIKASPDSMVTCTYHSAKKTYRAYGASVVIAGGMFIQGTEMFSSTLLAGPDIRKNDPCWCNSGKTFKQCHMKKFGAVYTNSDNIFHRPLPWRVEEIWEHPRPSGRINCVSSSFV